MVSLIQFLSKVGDAIVLCSGESSSCSVVFCNTVSFLDPLEVVEKYHANELFHKQFDEGRQNAAALEKRTYTLESMGVKTGTVVKVKAKATILNAAEFEKEMRTAPRQKLLRYHPSMEVPVKAPTSGNEMEKVWLFEYEKGSKFRSISRSSYIDVEKISHLQSQDSHLFRGQTNMLLDWSTNSEINDIGYAQVAGGLKSMDSFRSSCDSFGDEDFSLESDRPSLGPLSQQQLHAAGTASSDAQVTTPPPVPFFSGGLIASGGRQATQQPLKPSPTKRYKRGSFSVFEENDGSEHGADDAVSVTALSVYSTAESGSGRSSTTGRHIAKLRCEDALLHGNQGVARYHASEHLAKVGISSEDGQELKKHIAIFDAHDSISEAKVSRLSPTEVHDRLRIVTEHRDGKALPACVSICLVRHKAHNTPVHLTHIDVMSWYLFCKPFALTPATFDPFDPQTMSLDSSFNDKSQIFVDYFIKRSLHKLLGEGPSLHKAQLSVVSEILADIAENLNNEGTETSVAAMLMNLALGLRAVKNCIHLAMNDFEKVSESFFDELSEFKTSDDVVVSAVRCAFTNSFTFEEVMRKATVHNAVLKDCIPYIVEVHALLAQSITDGFAASVATLSAVVSKLPRVQRSFDCMTSSPLKCESALIDKLQSLTNDVVALDGSEHNLPNMRLLSTLIATVSSEMPFDPSLPTMQQDVAEVLEQTTKESRHKTFMDAVQTLSSEDISQEAWNAFVSAWKDLNGASLSKKDAKSVDEIMVLALESYVDGTLVNENVLNAVVEIRSSLGTESTTIDNVVAPLRSMENLGAAVGRARAKIMTGSDFALSKDVIHSAVDDIASLLKFQKELLVQRTTLEHTSVAAAPGSLSSKSMESITSHLEAADLIVGKISAFEVSEAREAVIKCHDEVADDVHGLPGKHNWLDGCNADVDWPTLNEHAGKTIMTNIAVPKLRQPLLSLGKAGCLSRLIGIAGPM